MKQHTIGQQLVYEGKRVSANVTLISVREKFGRVDYEVQDLAGRRLWVRAEKCKEAPKEEKV